MPRLKKSKYEPLQVLISGYVKVSGKSIPQVAEIMGCSEGTYHNRMKKPESFTIGELGALCWGLGIPIEQIREAIPR